MKLTCLPLELLEQVIESLLPTNPPVVFRSHDVITKTLISLTLTSKALSSAAYRLLYTFCFDIDSPRKLQLLAKSLDSPRVQNALSGPSPHPIGMYLAPYPDENLHTPEIDSHIHKICNVLSDKLRRLVIDIPIPKLYHLSDDPRGPDGLRYGGLNLNILTAVTEFCSLTDEDTLLTCDVCDDLAFLGRMERPTTTYLVQSWIGSHFRMDAQEHRRIDTLCGDEDKSNHQRYDLP